MTPIAIGWLTRSVRFWTFAWSPFTELTRKGRVTSCPLVRVAWHSKVVSTFAFTLLGQSTDCAGGRSRAPSRTLRASGISSDLSTVVVPPTETEAEHPARSAAIAQSARAAEHP